MKEFIDLLFSDNSLDILERAHQMEYEFHCVQSGMTQVRIPKIREPANVWEPADVEFEFVRLIWLTIDLVNGVGVCHELCKVFVTQEAHNDWLYYRYEND